MEKRLFVSKLVKLLVQTLVSINSDMSSLKTYRFQRRSETTGNLYNFV